MGRWGDHQGIRHARFLRCEGQASYRQPPACQPDATI